MNTIKFYGHFAAAYGSCWLLLLLCAFVTQSRIDLGGLGFFGLPAVSTAYAYLRLKGNLKLEAAINETGRWIDQQVAKFFKPKSDESHEDT
jgi:hypothetical protein